MQMHAQQAVSIRKASSEKARVHRPRLREGDSRRQVQAYWLTGAKVDDYAFPRRDGVFRRQKAKALQSGATVMSVCSLHVCFGHYFGGQARRVTQLRLSSSA